MFNVFFYTISLSLSLSEMEGRRLKGIQRSTETGLAVGMPSRTVRQASHESIEESMNSYGSEGKWVLLHITQVLFLCHIKTGILECVLNKNVYLYIHLYLYIWHFLVVGLTTVTGERVSISKDKCKLLNLKLLKCSKYFQTQNWGISCITFIETLETWNKNKQLK